MIISKRPGVISNAIDLTSTAREITFTLTEALECLPGSFINVFMNIDGEQVRRAFSIVTTNSTEKTVSVAVRNSPNGKMTPKFWESTIIGTPVEIMGPMGKNTSDKLTATSIHLFAFGIGAGIINAITEHALQDTHVQKISIVTGSRNESDIVYKSYFDELAKKYPHISVRYVISNPVSENYPYTGYIQNHVEDMNFDNSDVYMCGQEAACNGLIEAIQKKNPQNVTFFVEAFH